jgi:hypothetical protein
MLLSLGCGGAELDGTSDEGADETLAPELGVLSQALSFSLGYGFYQPDPIDSTAGFRCPSVLPSANDPNENDFCEVPSDKVLSFYINGLPDNTTTLPNGSTNPTGVNFRARAHAALATVQGYIGAGFGGTWTLSESSNPSATDGIIIGACPPNATACARPEMPLVFTHQPGYGWIGKDPRCIIEIVPAQFVAAAGGQNAWNAFSQNQKNAFVYNTIKHEISHCAGLPHVANGTPGPGGGKNLMLPVMPSEALTQDIALTTDQKNAANSYVN